MGNLTLINFDLRTTTLAPIETGTPQQAPGKALARGV